MPESRKSVEQLARFIDKHTLEIASLARTILAKMRKRYPTALELVYDNYNALAIGFGPTERPSEAIFSIVLYPNWVSLFFLHPLGLQKEQTHPIRIKHDGEDSLRWTLGWAKANHQRVVVVIHKLQR